MELGDDKINEDRVNNIINSIPNEPCMPLHNYLLELTDESDVKEASLYLNDINSFIKEIWLDITKHNKNARSAVSNKLNIYLNSIYGYKNGRKAISIKMMNELIKFSNNDQVKIWDKIFYSNFTVSTHSKHQKTKLPKHITPKLSYILGWICGDGHLKQMHNYVVKISEKSMYQLFLLKNIFKEIFDVETPIFKRYMNGYAIQIGSKPIYRFLTKVIKIKVGEVPEIVDSMDKVNKKYFLLGILDSEGYISGDYRIAITQSNREFLIKIMHLFNELNIKFTGPYFHKTKLGEWFTIQIRKKSEIFKFNDLFGSCHTDKKRKLEILVNKIENRNG